MTNPANTSSYSQSPKKQVHPLNRAEAAERTKEIADDVKRDSVDAMMRGTEDFDSKASQCTDICSDNVAAIVESGNVALRGFQNMSNQILENYNAALSACAEMTRDACACRTPDDRAELRQNVVGQLCDTYFTATKNLCNLLFDSTAEAMAPLHKRTQLASIRVRSAMAS